jgi:lysophospholipase L1-like esterase
VKRLTALMLVVAALLTGTGTAAADGPPKKYYLALGDSIPYGFQTHKVGLPPEAFDTGYADLFGARLGPRVTTVNYSCPGESSASFSAPCIWKASGHALHDDYDGAQLDAALSFLRSHRGRVSPITVSLNGNDMNDFVRTCPPGDLACIQRGAPAAIAAYKVRMATILGRLHRAAPDAEIIVVGAYNPNLGAFAFSDPLFAAVNAAQTDVARQVRGRFADPMPVFNPQGDEAAETAAICALTLLCTRGDAHPSDAGYAALADIVWDASGL